MTQIHEAQLEVDADRGVVYVHLTRMGITAIRISQLPRRMFNKDGNLSLMLDLPQQREEEPDHAAVEPETAASDEADPEPKGPTGMPRGEEGGPS